MSMEIKTAVINGINLADLKTNIDAFLVPGYVLLKKKVNQAGTEALLLYYNIYSKNFTNGKFVINADGSGILIYNNLYPVAVARGISFTLFTQTGSVGTGGCYTWVQLAEMMAAGIDNQSHTQTHTRLTTLTFPQIIAELTAANNDFIANGFPVPDHLAYPFGSFDDNVIAAVSTIYKSGRTIMPYENFPQFRNINKYKITTCYGDITTYPTNIYQVFTEIDRAANLKTYCIYYDHGYTTPAMYNTIIDYAWYRGLDIINYPQLFALLEP
jgi:peptidoglycan/xylan/chitin deacetylase (PgdA/CDA1 family)